MEIALAVVLGIFIVGLPSFISGWRDIENQNMVILLNTLSLLFAPLWGVALAWSLLDKRKLYKEVQEDERKQ